MKTPRSALAAAVAAFLLAGVTAGPARAAGDRWAVPHDATVTIRGHGFGHGHGMSQYGAEGAARAGLSYRQIADFYYGGTTWGTATGRVDVLITGDTSDDLVVLSRKGLRVRDHGTGVRTTLPENGASRWRITPAKNGGSRVGYLTKGTWHPWANFQGDGEFFARAEPITLVTPAGNRAYRGRLLAAAPSPGSLARDTVNDVSLESYIKGVVPLEMPALWSPEAVRAQAVAARTYAAYERDHPLGADHQICDTSSCQVYGGYDAEHPASNAAVEATRRQVLLADGKPAFTQFGASSGGWTSAGSLSYLGAREDPYDDWAGNPVHTWKQPVPDTLLERTWPALGDLTRIVVHKRDGHGDWGGRVSTLTLVGSRNRVVVSGDTFRAMLGLRSTFLTFKVAPRSGGATARPAAAPAAPGALAADIEGTVSRSR